MQLRDFGVDAPDFGAAAQQLMLLGCIYANQRDQIVTMIEGEAFLKIWHREKGTWPPSYAVIQQAAGKTFLCIEGTTSISQGISHLVGTFARRDFVPDAPVNGAWLTIAYRILDEIDTALGQTWTQGQVRISGHSYGAGLAFILACIIARREENSSRIQVMTFGEPRGLGAGFTSFQPAQHWRIVSSNDLVPTLPPNASEATLLAFVAPLQWSTLPTNWQHYGNLSTLYPDGGLVPIPPFTPLPPGVSIGFPDTHYIPNYWARVELHQRNTGGYLPGEVDLKAMATVLYKFPSIYLTPELPGWFVGPDGNHTLVPSVNPVENRAVATDQSKIIKHVWRFVSAQGASWSEVYWTTTAATVQTREDLLASLPGFSAAIIANRLKFLADSHKLESITASYLQGNRENASTLFNLNGTQEPILTGQGPAMISQAVVWNLVGLGGSQRKIWLRGFQTGAVVSSIVTGDFSVENGTLTKVFNWISNLRSFPYGILSRVKKPSIRLGLPNAITGVDGTTLPQLAIVTTQNPHLYAIGDQAIIAQCSSKDLPGINGTFSVLPGLLGANTFLIPYKTPSATNVTEGLGYTRKYEVNPVDVVNPARSQFAWVNARQTKQDRSKTRGAGRARVRREQS